MASRFTKRNPPGDVDIEMEDKPKDKKRWNLAGCVAGLSIISFLVAGIAIFFTFVTLKKANSMLIPEFRQTSGTIRASPFTVILDSSAAPIATTIANDLSDYINGEEYGIYSSTAQPHTVTIDAGALVTTWDGVNKIATFGGAKGDGFSFRVISKDLITITHVNNVAFS